MKNKIFLYDLSGKNDIRFSPPCWNVKLCLINNKIDFFSTTEGRKDLINSLKKEIRKANERENYLDEEERLLIKNFLNKIRKELELNN